MGEETPFEWVTTRGGDRGESGYYSGEWRRKDDLIFAAVGDIDEANSFTGAARAALRAELGDEFGLTVMQRTLLRVGAMVATSPDHELYATIEHVTDSDVEALEGVEQKLLQNTRIDPVFILPGETALSAAVDVARSVCRRSERRLVSVIRERGRHDLHACQNYLNRLSDYLFILARHVEQRGKHR
ncbi:MAG: cob(I)yrinic acid a,c-diamide adenosyltransferase [Spirochaetaceae bacterium]|nr:MAG: cob(I)yrinic acid a,c-diamide adenosyltransferase [Spirochaetaceae bacterium]